MGTQASTDLFSDYIREYWRYLRRERTHPPTPAAFALSEDRAAVIRIQCNLEYKAQEAKLAAQNLDLGVVRDVDQDQFMMGL